MPVRSIHTPFGDMTVAQEGVAIVSVDWGWGRDQDDTPLLREALAQLDAYFSGKLKTFDLPLAIEGTPFQRRVWQTMQQIPYGETRTYGDVAQELNSAARAVGGACGANRLPILIPCHRILGTGGIGGYSGGEGPATKQQILDLERMAARRLL